MPSRRLPGGSIFPGLVGRARADEAAMSPLKEDLEQ